MVSRTRSSALKVEGGARRGREHEVLRARAVLQAEGVADLVGEAARPAQVRFRLEDELGGQDAGVGVGDLPERERDGVGRELGEPRVGRGRW